MTGVNKLSFRRRQESMSPTTKELDKVKLLKGNCFENYEYDETYETDPMQFQARPDE